ncbi:RHS repeat protein [Mucilaginibacter robiniae]|uniref:RHS repeat protein n=1 Tax=Mucilaginibacter robiniae TaxID=2728022 RepID=A0A7L5E6W7_9SPHI|nr:RHS repeat domain-containing protein [Mucilaginibacter robiniae]QJD96116.1 RHS repeat protein [Mucilaginibacter robiniae]
MKLYIITLALLLQFSNLIFAQQRPSSINNFTLPKAPDIATLLKFAETPVSYFNGTANIEVPLYEIKTGDLSFPISINYNTSGIKVAEEAGWIGLGWNISTVGAVQETPFSTFENKEKFDIVPPSFTGQPTPQTVLTNVVNRGTLFSDSQGECHLYNIQAASANYEPDLYTMSANGISEKFFIPNGSINKQMVSVNGQNIRFTANGEHNFTAIMPDGTQYIFRDVAVTQTPGLSTTAPNTTFQYSVYLSQIISPAGRTISFKYSPAINTFSQQTRSQTWAVDTYNQFFPNDFLNASSSIQNLYLSEINFDNGHIVFNSSEREDMAGRKLDQIAIYKEGNVDPIKLVKFGYTYFADPVGSYGDYTVDNLPSDNPSVATADESYRQKRLKLLSVQIDNNPAYQFDYDSTPLPYKTSWAQDIWGYFNGNTIKSLLPNYNDLAFTDYQPSLDIIEAAKKTTLGFRAADFNFTKAGILTRVTYPTGGYTEYKYEPHTFSKEQLSQNLVDNVVAVDAIGTGIQQKEFDVPAVNYVSANGTVNPTYLNVRLFCQGGVGKCAVAGQGTAGGANPYFPNGSGNNNYSMYALLEKQNPNTGIWELDQNNIFDSNNSLISSGAYCGVANVLRELAPGHYRLTAQFPVNQTGTLGGFSSHIDITYKVMNSTVNKVTYSGPGLRIGQIIDYTSQGQIAHQRKISYEGGQLMTPTVFFRYSYGPFGGYMGPSCSTNKDLVDQYNAILRNNSALRNSCHGSEFQTAPPDVLTTRNYSILYSNPSLPYSYSANGSLYGYSTVYEQRIGGNNQDQGRTVYQYNCKPDAYFFYGYNLPGIPSVPYLDNGKLIEQQEQKRNDKGDYTTIHSVHYDYTIGKPFVYWASKGEYLPRINQDGSPEFSCRGAYSFDPQAEYLHFYPIKTGHVNVSSKIESSLDGNSSLIATTTYIYNINNQQRITSTLGSNGKTYTVQNYYPSDYNVTDDFTSDMRNANMLDYPIESVVSIDGQASQGSYNEYASHDKIITPTNSYALQTLSPFALTPSIPNNKRDNHYVQQIHYTYNSKGNLIDSQKPSGPTTVYLWGYNNQYPIAEVRNASYQEVAAVLGQATIDQLAGSTSSDAAAVRNALNVLRTDNRLKKAMVTTYTYEPLVGMTSQTDAKGMTTYYEYDGFQRLLNIKDAQGNIVKHYDYHYQNQ